MKLRRRIGSAFLALVMVLSLIPTVAVSALAADTARDLITFSYENDGSSNNKTINVKIYVDSESVPRDTFSVQGANTTDNHMTVKVNDSINYEIDRIEFDGGGTPTLPEMSSDLKSYSFRHTWGDVTANADPLELSVYLRIPLPKPDVPNGVYEGSGDVVFNLYQDQLLKMLYVVTGNADIDPDEIKDVTLHFTKNVGSAMQDSYDFYWADPTADYLGHYHITGRTYNTHGDVIPNNIQSITLTYEGTAVTIPADKLSCVLTSNVGHGVYEIKANDTSCCAVAFYEQGDSGYGNAGVFHLHDIAFVKPGETVTTMPEDPEFTSPVGFAGWSTEKSGGVPFNESYVVNSDMRVWAQKYSSDSAGTWIYVDNADNTFLDRFVELYNNQYGANISVNDVNKDSVKIQVNGENEEHTNWDYYTSPNEKTGWDGDGYAIYKVYNYNSNPVGTDPGAQHFNTHIPFAEIRSITISATVPGTGGNVTVEIEIHKGNNPGEFGAVIDGYGAAAASDGTFWLKMNQGKADDPVGPPDPGLGEANLTVEKTVAIDGNQVTTASVGDKLEYTITVTNSGDAAAENVKVWDSMWGHEGDAVNANSAIDDASVADGFCIINSISASDSVSITYTYTVPAEKAGTALTNNVWIGEKDDNPDATVTVTVDDLVYYNVNYHIVGDVGTSNWTNSVLAGTEYTYTVPAALPGYTFDGWYEKESDIGNADKKEPTIVTVNKKYEVYGKYVIDTEHPPEAPDEDAVIDLLDRCVQLKCDQVRDHKCGFALKEDSFTIGNCTENGNVWTVTVTVNADKYLEDYNTKGVGTHKLADGETGTKDIVLTWDATANNNQGAWVRPTGKLLAIFDITCKPDAPTTEELNTLFPNGVQVDCLTQGAHDNKDYDLEDNTYTTTVEQKDGKWTCKVIVTGETYVEKYEGAIGWPHTANNATRSVTLVWENGKWAKQDNNNVMVVFDVKCQAPGAPTYGQLKDLFKVQIDCITSDKWGDQYEHKNKDYAPIEGSYTLGNVTANANGTWDLVVTVKADKYVEQYSVDRNETHTLADAYSSKTVTLVYQNGAWTKPGDDIAFTFDVNCNPKYDLVYHGCGGTTENDKETVSSTFPYFGEAIIKNNPFLRDGYVFEGWALEDGGDVVYTGGEDVTFNDTTFPGLSTAKKAELYAVWALAAPDADDIANLDIKVVIDCIDNVGHEDGTYDLLDSRLADPTYVYTLGVVNQKDETCKLTIFAAEYVKAYGEEENIQARHKLADENVWYQTIELKWVDGKWTADTTKVTFNVTGDKEYDPNEPAVVNYTVNYFYDGEQNKDASYTGWGRAGDVVNRYIDKSSDGYTLDKVTGVPLTLAVDGENIINVYYATDKWNAETDDPTTGDSIPDYKQVLIAYTTDGSGTVSPTTQVETLEDNADGKYVGTVNVGSTATANEGYAFAFWMGPNDSTFWSKVLNTTLTVEGGKTYTYTATFGTDLIGPEDPTGEDPDKPGDGIPDKYQVVVKYVADKGGKITGKQVEVLTIYDADGHYSIVGDVTATGSQAAAFHNWDFSRWVAPNGGVASWHPTLDQQTIENAEGGNTYVFTAHFRYDPYIPPVVDPDPDDPTPPPVDPDDKPELNTEDHYAYIVGYPDGTVRPEGDITRAEVATIFFRLLTDESRDEFWSQTNDYTDVDADAWYNNAVSTLSNAGILNGYEDGTFQPDGNITRAEFATITARFFEATYEGEDLFSDIAGHWAADYINQAANAGIVDGYPDGTFRPQQNITRAEAMTMVNRTIDRHPDAEHFLDGMITWSDNHEDAWYYEQVQEATNSHEYTMNTDDEQNPYEIWTELLPVRDWAQLEKEWSDAHSGQSGGDVV